jgi:hypothetical protein
MCEHSLNSVIDLYVQKTKFLLILHSWGGLTNSSLHNEQFFDENVGLLIY